MGYTKRIGFNEDINDVANVFKALGHPARIQIMNVLLNSKSSTCGEIVTILPLAQSTVSKHLLELKKCELITISFSGKNSIYSVEKSKLSLLSQFINNYIEICNSKPKKTEENDLKSKEKINIIKIEPSKVITKKYLHLKNHNYQFQSKKAKTE